MRSRIAVAVGLALVAAVIPGIAGVASAGDVPPGFQDTVALSGLKLPTNVAFASDGKVFVTEKSGVLKVFSSLSDPTGSIAADLRTEVNSYWDRGLLGLAVDPAFSTGRPYVYVSYTYDHALGDAAPAPKWGTPNTDSDTCPDPPGGTTNGCVVSGRVSRLTMTGNVMTAEKVLVEDFCDQFPSHSIGDLAMGPDGALYAGAGDGASFTFLDHGQAGAPVNPCGDPVNEGGSLRAQDIETPSDPQSLDGSIIRIDPDTGLGRPGNPYASSGDANKARILANGFRNPYRFTFRPGTNELYLGDVGWASTEEINMIPDVTDSTPHNFGWPCYEGSAQQPSFLSANLPICTSLYARPGAVTPPIFQYKHTDPVVPSDGCTTGSSAPTGLAFAPTAGTSFPARYRGALFFTDYSRQCVWAMLPGTDGRPDPTKVELFVQNARSPVTLKFGPNGDLFYLEIIEGNLRRVSYADGNHPPTVTATAASPVGQAPLTTTLTATATDPDAGDSISLTWDLDGDGQFNDATGTTTAPWTFPTAGVFTPRVKATDSSGASTIATALVSVSSTILPAPSSAAWQANGSATFASAACVQLTPDTGFAAGSAWLTTPISSSSITASFDAQIGPGTGADGLTFALIDPASGPGAIGGIGGGEGFGGLTGVAVSLDTYQSGADPAANFVGIASGGTASALTYVATSTGVPLLRGTATSTTTTHVDVVVTNGRMQVFVAGAAVLDSTVTLPPTVRIGFTAGTGGSSQQHRACNVAMATPPLSPGKLTITPAFVDFGQLEVGQQGTSSVTLHNSGQSPLVIESTTLPDAPFSATAVLPVGASLAPGASVTQSLRFRPTVASGSSATFSAKAAGNDPAVTASLTGAGLPSTGPAAVITSPTSNSAWSVGDTINFAGAATRLDGTVLASSALTWSIILHHCSQPTVCHLHPINDVTGVTSGSFVAPDHDFPSYLEIRLTAVDGTKTTSDSVELLPRETPLTLKTSPPGLRVVAATGADAASPLTVNTITNSQVTIGTPAAQTIGGVNYVFRGWSDGGAASHTITMGPAATTLIAQFTPSNPAATDRCGASILPPLLSVAGWSLNGAAVRVGPEVMLTDATDFAAGSAVSTQAVSSQRLHVCADLASGGGGGADGLAIAFLDPTAPTTSLGGIGGDLGYVGIGSTGAAVAVDTFPGAGEPGADFIGVMRATGGYSAMSTTGVPDASATSLPVEIWVDAGTLVVWIGGTEVLRTAAVLPPSVRIAVTASTGGLSDQHVVANLVANTADLPTAPGTPTTVPPATIPPPPPPVTPPAITPTQPTLLQIWFFLILWRRAIDAENARLAALKCRTIKSHGKVIKVCTAPKAPITKKRKK